METDKFLDRVYDLKNYNCAHFVTEVWEDLTGEDISELCGSFVGNDAWSSLKDRKKLRKPESPCVAIMQNPSILPHAGIYVEGRILHITETGVKFEELSVLKLYNRISFYK